MGVSNKDTEMIIACGISAHCVCLYHDLDGNRLTCDVVSCYGQLTRKNPGHLAHFCLDKPIFETCDEDESSRLILS